jgi:hypothetical protein
MIDRRFKQLETAVAASFSMHRLSGKLRPSTNFCMGESLLSMARMHHFLRNQSAQRGVSYCQKMSKDSLGVRVAWT